MPTRSYLSRIHDPSLRRLARRGGVKRMTGDVYNEARQILKSFLKDLLRDALVYANHAKRKTITSSDVVHALRRNNRQIYGF